MRRVISEQAQLGECPTWDDRARRFRWIDVVGKTIMSSDADGGDMRRQRLDDHPGSFGLRENGGLIIGFRRGVGLFDENGVQTAYAPLDADVVRRQRFNDGAVDSRGRFWIGTMDKEEKREPIGGLYRIDADLSMHRLTEGIGLSNGIAWSPDDTLLYHCDSTPPRVLVHDFDVDSGEVSNRRVFVAFDSSMGKADGCAVDADGFLWVAALRTGRILRFDPDGRLERSVATPTMFASSIGFGGEDLRTMYITSLQPTQGPIGENDGAVFATEVDVPGLPVNRFAA